MEPVREQILNLQHISYTYHTLQGETLALSDWIKECLAIFHARPSLNA